MQESTRIQIISHLFYCVFLWRRRCNYYHTNSNNNNNSHHYHKRLGACLIPNGSVYIESRMNCCALSTRLNSSTASSDVIPVTSGSCLSGRSCQAKNLYRTFTSRLVTPGSNSENRSESVN